MKNTKTKSKRRGKLNKAFEDVLFTNLLATDEKFAREYYSTIPKRYRANIEHAISLADIIHPQRESPVILSSHICINIAKRIEKKSAMFYSEGLSLGREIQKILLEGKAVELSFKGLNKISTSFLNAALGAIYYKYSDDVIEKMIRFSNINPTIQAKLDEVIWRARNRDEHEKILNEIASDI